MAELEEKMMRRARDKGRIAKSTTDKELANYAEKVGYHHQSLHMLNNPPTTAGFDYFASAMCLAEHPEGSTVTFVSGDVRRSKAKQRANNTHLENEESLHGFARNEDRDLLAAKLASQKEYERESRLGCFRDDDVRRAMDESAKMAATPFVPPAVGTGESEETHRDVKEVRDVSVLKIVSAEDAEEVESHQMVLEQLTRTKDKPYDQQAINSNSALVRAGQNAEQRAESLAKIAAVRKRTGK